MELEKRVARYFNSPKELASRLQQRISSIHGTIVDKVVGFASDHYSLAALLSVPVAGVAAYKALESIYAFATKTPLQGTSQVTLISTAIGFWAGMQAYYYFREESHLRALGLNMGKINQNPDYRFTASGKGFLLQAWDSFFENPKVWALVPAAYFGSLHDFGYAALGFGYVMSYALLRVFGGLLHSDTFSSTTRHFIAQTKAKLFRKPDIYLHYLEDVVEKAPFTVVRASLVSEYARRGLGEEAAMQARQLIGDGIKIPRYSYVSFVADPLRQLVKALNLEIDGKSPAYSAYLALASILAAAGNTKVSDKDMMDRMVAKFGNPEASLLAFWYLHKMQRHPEEMYGHLGNALSRVYSDPERFRREPLGEDSSYEVFVVAHPLLKADVAFKVGPSMAALSFEADRTNEARALLAPTSTYMAPEPLFVGSLGSNPSPVYVRTQIRGRTLQQWLESGEAGLDDVLAAWEMTRILHRGIRPEASRVGYVPVRDKLWAVLSRESLNLPREVIGLLASCAAVVEENLEGQELVFYTDGHPENRVKSDGTMAVIDLEDKGVVHLPYEASKLFRWKKVKVLEGKEQEFLKQANVDEFPYLLTIIPQGLSVFSFRRGLGTESGNRYAAENLADVRQSIIQIRSSYPLSYSRNRRAFERTLEGVSRLEGLYAA